MLFETFSKPYLKKIRLFMPKLRTHEEFIDIVNKKNENKFKVLSKHINRRTEIKFT